MMKLSTILKENYSHIRYLVSDLKNLYYLVNDDKLKRIILDLIPSSSSYVYTPQKADFYIKKFDELAKLSKKVLKPNDIVLKDIQKIVNGGLTFWNQKEGINEGSLYSSQQLIQKLTPKIEKNVELLKKQFPNYDINLVRNRYERDGSYTLSISGKNTSTSDNNKLQKAIKSKIKESVNEASKEDIIKDLDKAKNDLLKKVEILIAKKKKLYSNIDVESPISADEKKLNKDIADIFSQIQQLILQKRTIKESVNEEQPHQKEMVDGIVEMLRQVEDIENRQKIALDRLHDFKEEGIEVDAKEFLERCGLGSVNEKWSSAYKKSINCSNPKGFSQRAHCQGRKKKTESMKSKLTVEQKMELFLEKNCPTDPAKWSASKAAAKRKFDVYPSAYANGWAAKNYKSKGGGWRTCKG